MRNLTIDGERAVDRVEGFHGFDVGIHLAFVVGRSARVEIAVALGGLERRRLPEFERVGRLDVEMAVAEDGRLAGRVQPVGVDQRMALGFDQFDVLEAGGQQMVDDEFGGAVGGLVILGKRGDAGDAQEVLQLFEEPGLVLFYVAVDGFGHVASF